jgi:hypothetical protein
MMLPKKDSRRGTIAAFACGLSLSLYAPLAIGGDVPITQEARTHFQAGVNLLRDPDGARYEEAYREFKVAYAASPSYKILGNLGLCAMKLERDGEAIEAYTNYLAHSAELDPAEARQVATDLQTLKTGVVKLTVTVAPTGAMLNDVRVPIRGERVINQYGPLTGPITLGLRPGHHQITLKLAGMDDFTWELDASAGSVETKEIALKKTEATSPKPAVTPTAPAPLHTEKSDTASRPVPTGVYIGLAASGAFLAAGAITGAMALSKNSEYQSVNDGLHVDQAQSLRDQGVKLNVVTDVLLGAGVVAGAVTGVLFFSRPAVTTGAGASSRTTARATWSPDVAVGSRGAELRLRGTF